MISTLYPAGCSITQDHHTDGSVDVSFKVSLLAPNIGETGTITVESDDMKWIGQEEVNIYQTGDQLFTVTV